VNQLVFPSNRPLHLELTSDTVMNAFYVPGLGSQIYAMAGMRTNLNLSVDHGVTLTGRNMQYSGRGFANQTFTVRAVTPGKFAVWVAKAKSAPKTLDRATYEAFAKPSSGLPVIHFSGVAPGLFSQIVAKNAAARPKKAEAGQVH